MVLVRRCPCLTQRSRSYQDHGQGLVAVAAAVVQMVLEAGHLAAHSGVEAVMMVAKVGFGPQLAPVLYFGVCRFVVVLALKEPDLQMGLHLGQRLVD